MLPFTMAVIMSQSIFVNGDMCGAMTLAEAGDDRASLMMKAFANFRTSCRKDGCDKPLGIEHAFPLKIEDKDFTASSFDDEPVYITLTAASARLNYRGGYGIVGGWKPKVYSDAWIQVQLGRNANVSGVITQGRDGDGDGSGRQQLVTQFKVMYTMMENPTLVYVKSQDGTTQVFDVNTEGGNTQVTNLFWQPVLANSIRIVPAAYEGGVVLRFELLGCLP